jgi:hypothetical protein
LSKGPGDLYVKLQMAIKAWSLLRPNKSFASFTLESFKGTVAPSFDLREEIAASEANTRRLNDLLADADVLSKKALRRLVGGVIADADEGEDSELYRELGYMPRSVRNSLLSARRAQAAELAAELAEKETAEEKES